jgi:histidinol dehydrogenase
MEIIRYPKKKQIADICKRPSFGQNELNKSVWAIIDAVKDEGDRAVKRFSQQFDRLNLDKIQVTSDEFRRAVKSVPNELQNAIKIAINNVETFHKSQKHSNQPVVTMPGVSCWQQTVAIEKVGLYIPGGSSPLFSSVIMLAVPAKIAGCSEISICSPPTADGTIHPTILFTASQLGVEQVFKIGGAQAIAAMAFGTETVPAVYKIFGPGNQYVTKAKQLVQTQGIAIDLPAGPSEVAIVADKTADPEFIAADLLSQAEHGPDSQVLLITTNEVLIKNVSDMLRKQLDLLPRRDTAQLSLNKSKMILVSDIKSATDIVNQYAPEHLILMLSDPKGFSHSIKNAGSVFLGPWTPEAAGDYASGTNHTLPTNGYARVYRGVSLDSFLKTITFQEISKEGLQTLGPIIQKMALAEDLQAHHNAVEIRLKKINNKSKDR